METIEMSNCCASVRVSFLRGLSCVCVCVSVGVCACRKDGVVCLTMVLLWDFRAGKRLQRKAHPGAAGCHWSLGHPSSEKGGDSCSLLFRETVVGVPYAGIIALLV